MDRRAFIIGCIAAAATIPPSSNALAQVKKKRKPFVLDERFVPQAAPYPGYAEGTVIIETGNHFLYLMLSDGMALRYGIGVGKAGLAFKGAAIVGRKAEWPNWRPTDSMIARSPEKYAKFAKGMPGGPKNPLGARALYLYRNNRDTFYRIHGTTEPWSIGKSVSNGCIRMINEHVIDLYERVPVGAAVIVKDR